MFVLSEIWSAKSLAYQLLGRVMVKVCPTVGWMVKVRLIGIACVGERSSVSVLVSW